MQVEKISNRTSIPNYQKYNTSFERGYIHKPELWPVDLLETYTKSPKIKDLISKLHELDTDIIAEFNFEPNRYNAIDFSKFNSGEQKKIASIVDSTVENLKNKVLYFLNVDQLIQKFISANNKQKINEIAIRKEQAIKTLMDFNKTLG